MCVGLIELVALIEGVSCSVILGEVEMNEVFESYSAAGIMPSAAYSGWLAGYQRVWVVEDHQAVS